MLSRLCAVCLSRVRLVISSVCAWLTQNLLKAALRLAVCECSHSPSSRSRSLLPARRAASPQLTHLVHQTHSRMIASEQRLVLCARTRSKTMCEACGMKSFVESYVGMLKSRATRKLCSHSSLSPAAPYPTFPAHSTPLKHPRSRTDVEHAVSRLRDGRKVAEQQLQVLLYEFALGAHLLRLFLARLERRHALRERCQLALHVRRIVRRGRRRGADRVDLRRRVA